MPNKFVDEGSEWKQTFKPVEFKSGSLNLPDTPTPEEFEQAEPIILQAILEEYYTDGMEPIAKRDYRRIAPGRYQGEFRDEGRRFSFNIDVDADIVSYRPINPEEID